MFSYSCNTICNFFRWQEYFNMSGKLEPLMSCYAFRVSTVKKTGIHTTTSCVLTCNNMKKLFVTATGETCTILLDLWFCWNSLSDSCKCLEVPSTDFYTVVTCEICFIQNKDKLFKFHLCIWNHLPSQNFPSAITQILQKCRVPFL